MFVYFTPTPVFFSILFKEQINLRLKETKYKAGSHLEGSLEQESTQVVVLAGEIPLVLQSFH